MEYEAARVLARAITTLSLFGASIGQGILIGKALEGMARNPDMSGVLFTRMIIGVALTESAAIYAIITFFIL